MQTIIVQDERSPRPKCPKCGNTDVKDGGPGLRGKRAYDIVSDTFGLMTCRQCRLRASWAAFHQEFTRP